MIHVVDHATSLAQPSAYTAHMVSIQYSQHASTSYITAWRVHCTWRCSGPDAPDFARKSEIFHRPSIKSAVKSSVRRRRRRSLRFLTSFRAPAIRVHFSRKWPITGALPANRGESVVKSDLGVKYDALFAQILRFRRKG